MIVAETIDQVRREVTRARSRGEAIGLVPTMGKLHAGHCSLIDAAKESCDYVVVSIFVNPTQFGPGEDFDAYPRSPAQDEDACRKHGVNLIFAPNVEAMYDSERLTTVSVERLTKTLCGRTRPSHFTGVCTVVAKLFNIVQPDKAFFGAKDFQQAVVIKRMTKDLNFPVHVVVCPTVREEDGLAMSSRNAYLEGDERTQAAALSASLAAAEKMIHKSHPPAEAVIRSIKDALSSTVPAGEIDYVQVVDPESLSDVESTDRPVLVALAVRIGSARLIDNMVID